MNTTALLLGLLISSVGFGYFLYGRKQSLTSTKYTGLALMVMPYFLHDNMAMLIVAGLLLLLPRLIDRLLP